MRASSGIVPRLMNLVLLHNDDANALENDPGREAREDVERVALALAAALTTRGHRVRVLAAGANLTFLGALKSERPELVVNLCESLEGDARGEMLVPSLLELLGLPYTGSPALALGLALHKDRAKQILRGAGISTPGFAVVEQLADLAAVDLEFPLIVKPAREDASTGIDFESVVSDRAQLERAVVRVLTTLHQPALIEQYIAGREIYVPIFGNAPRRALPLTEIEYGPYYDERPRIVSYKAKWELESIECIQTNSGPALLDRELEERCIRTAFAAFDALGCRDYGRVDLRVTADGRPMVIDINPNCDLHPEAGYARTARNAGLGYAELAESLVQIALDRSRIGALNHEYPSHSTFGPGAALVAAESDAGVHAGRDQLRA